MKKLVKAIISTVAMAVLLSTATHAYANENLIKEYDSVAGTITNITELRDTGINNLDGKMLVLVEGEDGKLMNFHITENTYIFTDNKPEIGKHAVGFYDNKGIAILIYPPQMRAVAFAVSPDGTQTISAGFFDENLINEDNTLKLNIADSTEILNYDGSLYEGEVTNKNLAVLYTVSTRSIPAQTTPIKVVVLPDKAIPPVAEQDSGQANDMEEAEGFIPDATDDISISVVGIPIEVNGSKLEDSTGYNEGNAIMVPLRAAAEALGYDVGWNAQDKSITLDNAIKIYINRDFYVSNDVQTAIGIAPVVNDGVTFVPLNFFSDILEIDNADIVNWQINLVKSN